MLRTTSLFFPDGQAGGQVAARSLRWAFLAKSEGGKERESERGDGGVGDDDGGEREREKGARVVDEFSGLFLLCQLRL